MTTLNNGVEANITQTQPLWLLAEITYRCPLHCAFCYNPTDYADHTKNELNTDEWIKVLRDARKMGAPIFLASLRTLIHSSVFNSFFV